MGKPILPGATLGILGGGQLGRMMAMSARTLGYHVAALDPDSSCAARFVVDRCIAASFADVPAAVELAKGADVVTLEIEKVSIASLRAAAKHAPVRPGAGVMRIVQDRAVQKRWLAEQGFPVGPFAVVSSAKALSAAAKKLGPPLFVKATRGGYDGRGQVELARVTDAAKAWAELAAKEAVAEKALHLDRELSVLVARRPGGQMAVHPIALNEHVRRILDVSVLPAPIAPKLAKRAAEIAQAIATELEVVGLLVVELFLTKDGELLVNELAPRPHNTFHGTEIGCLTSQFEQAVRAVCDLPLGSTELIKPVAIYNLLGDLWLGGTPRFERALAMPGVRLHLYGKREARPGRKMGHLSAVGATPQEAADRVRAAREALGRS
jgi:5-(carboxyamino)imidazole ribonucleotide synthase